MKSLWLSGHRICRPSLSLQVPGRLESQVYCDRALGTCSCLAHESVPKLKRVRHEGVQSLPRHPSLPPALDKGHQEVLTVGGDWGCQSQDEPGLQLAPAPTVPTAPVAAAVPSGASSSCIRLSCSGELPRDWKSAGEVLSGSPAAEGGVPGVATRDVDSPRSAGAHGHGCLGAEVRSGKKSGCEAGGISDAKFRWSGKKAAGRAGVTGEKEKPGKTNATTGATGPANGGGWALSAWWASMGTARLVWAAPDPVATVPGAGTIPGAGNKGREYAGTGSGKGTAGQLDCDVSDRDQAVVFRPTSGGRWGASPPDPVLPEESRGLTRLDFSFRFFPFFFQEESIPEVFLSLGAAKIIATQ